VYCKEKLGHTKAQQLQHKFITEENKGVCHQKKNYGNSNISPCKNYNLQKNPLKGTQNPSRYYNSITKRIPSNL
jgi:hypothetical protein